MGWDTLDLVKARVRGWNTLQLFDLPFRHHRVEGNRDGGRVRTWAIQGRAAYYMDYRPSYLLARTIYRSLREPAAVGLLLGYLRARVAGLPRCDDEALREYVRLQQRLRNVPQRAREALRRREALVD